MNKVTAQMVLDAIASEHYFTAYDGRAGAIANGSYSAIERPIADNADLEPLKHVIICTLILNNGHKIVGVNTGAFDASEFSVAEGQRRAKAEAIQQLWGFMTFELRCRQHGAIT